MRNPDCPEGHMSWDICEGCGEGWFDRNGRRVQDDGGKVGGMDNRIRDAVLVEIYDVAYTLLNLTDKDLKQTQELRQMLTECGEALLKTGKFLEKNFVAAYYLKKALEELVYLKDHLKHVDPMEYERRKPLAWEAAREALAKARGEVADG